MAKHPDLRVVAATLNSGEDASSTESQLYEGEELRLAAPLCTALIVREADGHLHVSRETVTTGYSDVIDFVVNSILPDRRRSAVFDPVELRAMAEGLAPETAMLVAVIHPVEEGPLRQALRRRNARIASTSLTAQMLEYALSRGILRQESGTSAMDYAPPPGAGPDVPPDDE